MKHDDTEQAEPGLSRLAELETVTLWEGEITNERIRTLLGVKQVYASRLLSALSRRLSGRAERSTPHAPLEMLYASASDGPRKSPDPYLHLLSSYEPSDAASGAVVDARLDLSHISPVIFSRILRAIRQTQGIEIEYRSMNHPLGTKRIVFPHSLVRAPRRWHMRAWCTEREDFRDFTLGRIGALSELDQKSEKLRKDDVKWNRITELAIGPHPTLDADQRKMIAAEFFPGAALLKLRVRECLAPYVIQDLRVATEFEKQTPPEYQLALMNAAKLGLEF
jgi:predicted DNA-binding transcriptional regulator YafY